MSLNKNRLIDAYRAIDKVTPVHPDAHHLARDIKIFCKMDKTGKRLGCRVEDVSDTTIVTLFQPVSKTPLKHTGTIVFHVNRGSTIADLVVNDTDWDFDQFKTLKRLLADRYGSSFHAERYEDTSHQQEGELVKVKDIVKPSEVLAFWSYAVFGPRVSFMRKHAKPHIGE